MNELKKLSISSGEFTCYTDGSCYHRNGGWGFVLFNQDVKISAYGGAINTTVNQMEVFAAIMALSCFQYTGQYSGPVIKIHTDSRYLHDGITDYVYRWKKNGFKSTTGTRLKNVNLWRKLYSMQMELAPSWQWVPSHSGIEYNEVADTLAGHGRQLANMYKLGKKVNGSVHNFFDLNKNKKAVLVHGAPRVQIENLR